jgi:hypothetical protein
LKAPDNDAALVEAKDYGNIGHDEAAESIAGYGTLKSLVPVEKNG